MAHPLHALAERMERRAKARRSLHALRKVEADPHLARDVGLPYRHTPKERTDLW